MLEDGRRAFRDAQEMMVAAYGPGHPELFQPTYGLALLEEIAGRDEQAQRHYEQALEFRSTLQGREDAEVAHIYYGLAGVAERKGDRELAERRYLDALAILERLLGADHPDVARVLDGFGAFYATGGDYGAARGYLERAPQIERARLPAGHPDFASTLVNLAISLEALGEAEMAAQMHPRRAPSNAHRSSGGKTHQVRAEGWGRVGATQDGPHHDLQAPGCEDTHAAARRG